MSFIAFVPGLNDQKAIATQTEAPAPGTNYYAVQKVAERAGIPCVRLNFQTAAKPYPTLTEMGLIVGNQITDLQDAYGDQGILLGSGSGTGIAFQSLLHLEQARRLPHIIAFKPVVDLLNAISTALEKIPGGHGSVWLEKLQAGEIPYLPVPLEPSSINDKPGSFLLTKTHYNDPTALRLISDETSFSTLSGALAGRKIPSLTLIIAKEDTTARENLAAFGVAASAHTQTGFKMVWVSGTHDTNHSDLLATVVKDRLDRMPF